MKLTGPVVGVRFAAVSARSREAIHQPVTSLSEAHMNEKQKRTFPGTRRWLAAACVAAGLGVFVSAQSQTSSGPPTGGGPYRPSALVELVKLDPTIRLDIRYATPNNFVGRAVYPEARAFLQRPAAEALLLVQRRLKEKGYGLVVFDAYRPWSITKVFWDITPADKKMFVANPATGSKHNRGCAVDIGLYDLKTGQMVEMPGDYDEMSERSFVTYAGGTAQQRAHRDLLRKTMEQDGYFFVYPEEWWHYDFKDFREYAVQDIPFSAIGPPPGSKRQQPRR